MSAVDIVFFVGLGACALTIAYQDFKERLISVWLIGLFAIICFSEYLIFERFSLLLENLAFVIVYFIFSYAILSLYYFLKHRRFVKIVDSKVGIGDILLVAIVGLAMNPISFVLFTTIVFSITLFIHLLFIKGDAVPLAGVLVILFFLFRLFNFVV